MDTNLLLPKEQKGCGRKSRGTNDLLFIDKMIIREVEMRKGNLSVALDRLQEGLWYEFSLVDNRLFGDSSNISSKTVVKQ